MFVILLLGGLTDFGVIFTYGSPGCFLAMVRRGRWRCCQHPENMWAKSRVAQT